MIEVIRQTIIENNGNLKRKAKEVELIFHSFEELEIHRTEILKKLNKKKLTLILYTKKNENKYEI